MSSHADRTGEPRRLLGHREPWRAPIRDKQNPVGSIIEIPKPKPNNGNAKQHPNGNKKGGGHTEQQRKDFDNTRRRYWRKRATDELKRRGIL